MSAGTLTLTNNSDLVSGVGTSFSTELTAGDFVVATVGGVTYTLPVKSVEGDTEITLISKYPGPTHQGSAWNAVPRATQNQVTAALVVQSTEALRGLNYDKQNWQAVFSVDGHITVMLPDGSSFSGPSWLSIANILNTLDVEYLDQLAAQIKQDAQQVEADKNTVVETASQVSTDAQTASTAATGAQGSAADAAESETNAEGYKELARKYAFNPEDNPVTGSEYSALHYSEKARKSAEDAASHNPAEALVKSLNLSDLADRAAAWLNVRPIGSTPLAGDPVNPYDATTQRWVENYVSGGGGTGPTMNGVQNFGVGMPILWTSRAFTPAWAVVSDGQILNRADWPELWVHAQMHTPIDDADWLANPGKRGNYSNGDGSTTFRVPDFNGVQSGSIPGLFGRGDQGGLLPAGNVYESAAPNISGRIGAVDAAGRAVASSGTGAFSVRETDLTNGFVTSSATGTPNRYTYVYFDANSYNPVYGRSANQVWPNSFVGVWIIRASGGFTAANTLWTVTNADASLPGSGTLVKGGEVKSVYRADEKTVHEMAMQSGYTVGNNLAEGNITQSRYDASGVLVEAESYGFRSNGLGGSVITHIPGQTNSFGNWQKLISTQRTYFLTGDTDTPTGGVVFGFSTGHAIAAAGQYGLQVCGRNSGMWFRSVEGGNFQGWQKVTSAAVCDATLKDEITDTDGTLSLENIKAMELKTFVYKDDDKRRVRRGVIAQQIRNIDPCYVKEVHNGDEVNLVLDSNPLLLDAISAVKVLARQVEELQAELKTLKGE
ncbi:tail fiber domain-containing protein [Citrobacter amalonaticus]|uniref:tail fiber domain-containing protein n=1 Tax=Citrobacter amalonaticus TaxID=35703 RepID=UPI002932BE06|nr:tail fiber domain-containing protein [Citrobacter amalonaticus]MEB0586094.1 tail fiber domain-containing protein [Citrobacter amalonaticus]